MYNIGKPGGLTGRVNLRVTEEELTQLREDADLAGLSLSELVRRRYFGMPIIASADEAMIRELRRQGGLLKSCHNASDGKLTNEYAAALKSLAAAIESLAKSQ